MNKKSKKYFLIFLILILIILIVYSLFHIANKIKKENNINSNFTNINISSNINSFDIDLDSTTLIIEKGNNFNVSTNNKYITYKDENGKIKIDENDHFSFNTNYVLKIIIPENYTFNSLEIESDAGVIDINSVKANLISLELNSGELTINKIEVYSKLKINGGAGSINILSSNINNLDLNMGVGNCNLNVYLKGFNKISAGVGQLNIDLFDSINNYTFKLFKGIGDIDINNEKIKDNYVYGNGNTIIEIEGGIGPINIISNK